MDANWSQDRPFTVSSMSSKIRRTGPWLNNWILRAVVDEAPLPWHSSVPASSPCEHEVYFGGSAATARFAMRLSKLSKSRSCAFSLVLNDSTTLRVSILVIQRAKMLMIRFSASVVRAVRIIETVQSSGFSFKRMPPKPSCDSQHAGPLRVNHVQCLVHSTSGLFELIMVQQSQQRLATLHHLVLSLALLDGCFQKPSS